MKASIKVNTEHVYGTSDIEVEAEVEMGGDDPHNKAVAYDMATFLNALLDAMAEQRAERRDASPARGRVVEAGEA